MASGPSPELVALAAAVAELESIPERVLETECGAGAGVLFLAREFPTARVRGIDRSADAIRAAIASAGLDPEGRVAFKRAPRRGIPYPSDHFDLVVQSRGRPRLAEVTRVLRAGGYLIYVKASSRRRLTSAWSMLSRGLRRRRFQLVASVDIEGRTAHVMRLAG